MSDPTHVIYELTGPHAGETIRLAGFEFVNGELQVPAKNVASVEAIICRFYGAVRKTPAGAPTPPDATPYLRSEADAKLALQAQADAERDEALKAMPYADVVAAQIGGLHQILNMTKTQIVALDGIGPKRADEIVKWRADVLKK